MPIPDQTVSETEDPQPNSVENIAAMRLWGSEDFPSIE